MSHFATTRSQPWWLSLLLLLASSLLGACGGGGSPAAAPTITAQPVDTSVVAGTAATLSVAASGAGIVYEWQSSSDGIAWAAIAGATASSYTTPATAAADNGRRFRVVVSAGSASTTSSVVTLTVTPSVVAPVISVQPAPRSVTAPDAASFSVTASGTAPAYQWQRSGDGGATWADIAAANAATYDTGATTTALNDQRYRVVIGNAGGSVVSAAVVLTVQPAPVLPAFTTQPANQSVSAGAAASFTVAATGTPAPALQWQRSTDGGATWAVIAAATDATYSTGPTTLSQNGERYRAVASNSAGSTASDAATLAVTAAGVAPSITGQPADVTIQAGQAAAFSVSASGTPTPTLQWQLSTDNGATWSNINGATSDVLSLPAGVPLAHNGRRFRAVASNASGSVTSYAALLTVRPVFVQSFQFNLFGFNAGPAAFLLYGGSVKDDAGSIDCSGYSALPDPCPQWRGDYPSGTSMTLTARPWPGFRVRRWVGGDCGAAAGTATTVTLIIDHNSNCHPQFEPIPGATFNVSAVPAGPWVGLVVEVVVDRFGNLVVPDTPRISCGPYASAQICGVNLEVADSSYTVLRLRARPLDTAPVGQLRWTCSSTSPEDDSAVVRTGNGADIAIGPVFSNMACSAELVPG